MVNGIIVYNVINFFWIFDINKIYVIVVVYKNIIFVLGWLYIIVIGGSDISIILFISFKFVWNVFVIYCVLCFIVIFVIISSNVILKNLDGWICLNIGKINYFFVFNFLGVKFDGGNIFKRISEVNLVI